MLKGDSVQWKQSEALQSSQCPAQRSGVPQTPLVAGCLSTWDGGGLLPLLAAPTWVLVLSLPLPGPSELKAKLWVSQGRKVIVCWVCGAEAGGRQDP